MHLLYHPVGLGVVKCRVYIFRSLEAIELDNQVSLKLPTLINGEVQIRIINRNPMIEYGKRDCESPRIQDLAWVQHVHRLIIVSLLL